MTVSVYMTSEYIELPVIGDPLAIVNTSRELYVSYHGNYLGLLTLQAPSNVSVTYLTELAEFRDGEYVTEFYNPYKTITVYLPLNSLILEVSNLSHFRKSERYYELIFSEGYVRLSYVYIETSRGGDLGWVWPLVAGLAAFGGVSAYFFYRKRRKYAEELEVLDERDRAIVSALKAGPMTPQELIKLADMSKATFYRRIKRLISMGYLEQVKKEGKVYYRLRKDSGD